jgi:hypothetical protein
LRFQVMRREIATSSAHDQRTANSAERHTAHRTAVLSATRGGRDPFAVVRHVRMHGGHPGGDRRKPGGNVVVASPSHPANYRFFSVRGRPPLPRWLGGFGVAASRRLIARSKRCTGVRWSLTSSTGLADAGGPWGRGAARGGSGVNVRPSGPTAPPQSAQRPCSSWSANRPPCRAEL